MSRPVGINVLLLVLVWTHAIRAVRLSGNQRFVNTEDYIRQYQINSERYRITTDDGYQLIVYRLRPTVPVRGIALLQHGIQQSSAGWLQLSANLPMQLLDSGIEVWLGNSRASQESHGHPTAQNVTWRYSFHEIGYYDLPAMIDAALQISTQKRIHVIGYSEGSTAALVLLSERPSYNSKIASLNLIAPAAFMGNSANKFAAQMYNTVRNLLPWLLPQLHASIDVAGTTLKQLDHYRQLILSGCFQQYDYGASRNYKVYGSSTPPKYRLKQISSPVVLHYGVQDTVVHPTDVKLLGQQLSKSTKVRMVAYESFKHTDFLGRQKAASEVYPGIVAIVTR